MSSSSASPRSIGGMIGAFPDLFFCLIVDSVLSVVDVRYAAGGWSFGAGTCIEELPDEDDRFLLLLHREKSIVAEPSQASAVSFED